MGVTVSVYMCVCMYISMCVLCECGVLVHGVAKSRT